MLLLWPAARSVLHPVDPWLLWVCGHLPCSAHLSAFLCNWFDYTQIVYTLLGLPSHFRVVRSTRGRGHLESRLEPFDTHARVCQCIRTPLVPCRLSGPLPDPDSQGQPPRLGVGTWASGMASCWFLPTECRPLSREKCGSPEEPQRSILWQCGSPLLQSSHSQLHWWSLCVASLLRSRCILT